MTSISSRLRMRRAPSAETPLREALLSMERLDDRALALAASFTVDPNPRRRARTVFPRFHDNARVLRRAYRTFADDVHGGQFVTSATEWLLDNFHLVTAEIGDVQRNLPRSYYRELPTLAARSQAGQARIYAIAIEILRHSDSLLDERRLRQFLNSYQRVAPLMIGELWAWPSMLKLALIENLRRLAEQMLKARAARRAADDYVSQLQQEGPHSEAALPADPHAAYVVQLLHRVREYGPKLSAVRASIEEHLASRHTTSENAIRDEHQQQATTQITVANVMASLRLCATIDWRAHFEAVSLVEQVLRQDPAGVYGRMDFLSRDRQRQAVEAIALPSGEAQVRVGLRAIESARQAQVDEASQHGPPSAASERVSHVGYHLIGPGRRNLEADVAYRPSVRTRLRRLPLVSPTATYLGAVALGTALLIAGSEWYAFRRGGSIPTLVGIALLLLIPASEVAIALVHRLAARWVPPRRLSRLDFSESVPAHARTMVVVPTILTDVANVTALLKHMEVLALGNLDTHIHFAILSDFADAAGQEAPGDSAILSAARSGVDALNARFGAGHENRFYLFHRERRWNAREGSWIGWERKRGKIEEFNRLLRGATDTSFHVQVGALAVLPSIRYCLTLDSDTRLPRDAAKKLIGIMAHPLNRPRVDAVLGRVVEGYGILQPRVSVTMASAAGSLFARTSAGHTGVDPYTTAVSDVYQDLFDEGIFTGKGLYDVDAFMAVLQGRVPENALLSHDLFEGLYARTALVTDVEVVDDYPSSVLAHARRQHRWVRGDWQILWWLFPFVPARTGVQRNHLPLIARWKIFDNLRRSLVAPATFALFLLGWTVLPGSPAVWTALGLVAAVYGILTRLAETGAGPRPQQPWRMFLRGAADDLRTAGARALLQLAFVANQAYQMVHAVGTTLVRLGITRHRLLEWETTAASAARGGQPTLRVFLTG